METPDRRFVSLDEIVRGYLISAGEQNDALYNKALHHAIEGCNEIGYDVYGAELHLLPVDADTKQAEFPENIANYTAIGVINQVNEFVPLTRNPNLAFAPKRKKCKCPCGCTGGGCSLSVPETTYGEAVVPTDSKECTYRTEAEITYQTCDYEADLSAVSFGCDYTFDLSSVTFPATVVSYDLGGVTQSVNTDASDDGELADIMTGLGFTDNGDGTFTIFSDEEVTNFNWSVISPPPPMELREDGGFELREDGGNEEREY